MAKKKTVSDTELAIMGVLWERGPIAVRDIVDELYGEYKRSLHATVQSLLDRLIEKGLVAKEAGRGANLYSAAIVRSEFVGKQLEQIASSHFDGAVTPMLHALVDHAKLSRKDRAAIRRIIDELDS